MITYLDAGSGVAGDMLIGALVSLGLSPRELNAALAKAIPVKGWKVIARPVERQMWPAISIVVEGDRAFGSASKMQSVIARAKLPAPVKARAHSILKWLQDAEKQAHGTSHPQFEDRGLALLDTLVDVIGSSWGLWRMGIDRVRSSPLQTGRLSPAAAWMIQKQGIPVYSEPSRYEMATPTGVAILSVIVDEFGWMPTLKMTKAGYGAGQKDIPGKPNVLALYQGKPLPLGWGKVGMGVKVAGNSPPPQPSPTRGEGVFDKDSVILLETVIDDMDPRLYPHVTDLLFKAGALDVWWAPIGMKKGRPGIAFSVLGKPSDEMLLAGIFFKETTTLGLRRQTLERWILPRKAEGLRKVAWLPNGRRKVQIEFEEAKKMSHKTAATVRKLLKYPS